jgi:hypothetical protein
MRRRRVLLFGAVALALVVAAVTVWSRGAERIASSDEAHRRAAIYPDYPDTVIPLNIAPLNLKVLEAGQKYLVRISGAAGPAVEIFDRIGSIRIPPDAWRGLLEANAGRELKVDIYVKRAAAWTHFDTLRLTVAADAIDPYVVYRYIPPIYDKWGQISIRQRSLTGFEERILFDNERSTDASGRTAGSACVNCHTFLGHRTGRMLLHSRPSRSGQIPAMILVENGRARKVDTRVGGSGAASYPAWHPDGKLIAFSRNSLLQIFHTAGEEVREVIDRDSDLGLYDVVTGRSYTVPQISRPDRLESWPAWSPDGRYLYFSSARQLSTDRKNPPPDWQTIRYDLDRVAFDARTGKWGGPETVVAAEQLGRSVSEPQISPDGKFLMFTGHDHGSFPIFQPSADLYLVNLAEITSLPAAARRLDEINSGRADSYHSWSSNSRWVIFSSKREDGTFTRLYIAHADGAGRFSKPFVLPQEDPEFYRQCLMVFNRPEFISEPVKVTAAELTRAINSASGGQPGGKGSEEPYRPLR